MSTKTTFKRIALATVAVMGFGLLSVAPAQAAALTVNQCTALTTTPFYVTGAVGTSVTNAITATTAAAGDVGDICEVTASVVTKPVGSTALPTLTAGTAANANYTLAAGASAQAVKLTVAGTPAAQTAVAFASLAFTPDVPGKYQFKLTPVITQSDGTVLAASTGLGYLSVYATGITASVASSGIGNTSATAVTGGQAKINFGPGLTQMHLLLKPSIQLHQLVSVQLSMQLVLSQLFQQHQLEHLMQ